MTGEIKVLAYQPKGNEHKGFELFSESQAKKARAYHQTIPGYEPTPLINLENLSAKLGVKGIYVKDESFRFGLNAFKSLGSSYCMGELLTEKLGLNTAPDFSRLTTNEAREALGEMTFVTATDGNHGRGVAWSAKMLGHKSVVLMPKGTAAERLENIRKLGADAWITDVEYDATVQMAAKLAKERGGILVQDTAWAGYESVPLKIMQGYLTLGLEIVEAMKDTKPTHLFLQAGVGSMAAAVAAFFVNYYGKECPKIIIVEPNGADCLYKTAEAADGAIHAYEGELNSIMAGLCCGIPCTVAWDLLDQCADCFVSMPDWVAADGMRILGAPLPGDTRIISGESGASCFGLAADLLRKPELSALKEKLGLDENSVILCLSTEGATDRENYRRIVWEGAYSS